MTPRHVTVGLDGSRAALRALDRAAEEAVLRGAAPDVAYAVSGGVPSRDLRPRTRASRPLRTPLP